MGDFCNSHDVLCKSSLPTPRTKSERRYLELGSGISGEFENRKPDMISFFLPRRLAAKYVRDNYGVRCSEKWLAKLVVTGGGPRYWKDSRAVLYRRDVLDAWVAGRVSGPWTSSSDSDANGAAAAPRLRAFEGMPYIDA